MSDPDIPAPAVPDVPADAVRPPGVRSSGMSLSMHDGVDASCDCCSCEAEPYWIEAMAEPPPPAGKR